MLFSKECPIKKIDKGMVNKETSHSRLICSLRAGFLWYKLDNFMKRIGDKRLDFNPECLPELDFLTQVIEYVDPDNQMELLKQKVIFFFIKNLIIFRKRDSWDP